jgi:hypothetical protein
VKAIPFVLRGMQSSEITREMTHRDMLTSEEPLAAVVATSDQGYVLARDSRLTRVAPETTDDR